MTGTIPGITGTPVTYTQAQFLTNELKDLSISKKASVQALINELALNEDQIVALLALANNLTDVQFALFEKDAQCRQLIQNHQGTDNLSDKVNQISTYLNNVEKRKMIHAQFQSMYSGVRASLYNPRVKGAENASQRELRLIGESMQKGTQVAITAQGIKSNSQIMSLVNSYHMTLTATFPETTKQAIATKATSIATNYNIQVATTAGTAKVAMPVVTPVATASAPAAASTPAPTAPPAAPALPGTTAPAPASTPAPIAPPTPPAMPGTTAPAPIAPPTPPAMPGTPAPAAAPAAPAMPAPSSAPAAPAMPAPSSAPAAPTTGGSAPAFLAGITGFNKAALKKAPAAPASTGGSTGTPAPTGGSTATPAPTGGPAGMGAHMAAFFAKKKSVAEAAPSAPATVATIVVPEKKTPPTVPPKAVKSGKTFAKAASVKNLGKTPAAKLATAGKSAPSLTPKASISGTAAPTSAPIVVPTPPKVALTPKHSLTTHNSISAAMANNPLLNKVIDTSEQDKDDGAFSVDLLKTSYHGKPATPAAAATAAAPKAAAPKATVSSAPVTAPLASSVEDKPTHQELLKKATASRREFIAPRREFIAPREDDASDIESQNSDLDSDSDSFDFSASNDE